MADIFAEVASVGIQGLSSGGTVYVVPGATGSTGAEGVQGATGLTGAAGASGVGGGGSVTVSEISGATGGATGSITNAVTGVTALRFDKDTGFNVSNLGSGEVKVSLGSAYKTIKVAGQSDLVATGEDTLEVIAGTGVTITTNSGSNPKALTINATGGAGATGATGSVGGVGATGIQGPTGGASGPQGVQGASGIQGIQGASGATGLGFTFVGFWDISETYNQNDVTLYDNIAYVWIGPNGENSVVSPDIDDLNVRWLRSTGPDGLQGATGASGIGEIGATGPQGLQGASGLGGASGYIGSNGATGTRGATGAQGLTGATGVGTAGATGVGIIQTITFTTSSTDETIIDVIDITSTRSIKYEMQETSGSSYNASELRLLNSNENVFLTQYAGIGAPLGVFDTYFSPVTNNYSSPDINSGMSYWNGTTLRIYTSNNIVIQALLSAAGSTEMTLNSSAYTITLATAFTEISTGIYQATTVESRSPLQLISNIAWTGTGFCELRYTPNNAVTTLKYQKTEIEV